MKVSYISCDFCDASTLTDNGVVMYTNKGRRCSENMYKYICSECIKAASDAISKKEESLSQVVDGDGRKFKEAKV